MRSTSWSRWKAVASLASSFSMSAVLSAGGLELELAVDMAVGGQDTDCCRVPTESRLATRLRPCWASHDRSRGAYTRDRRHRWCAR